MHSVYTLYPERQLVTKMLVSKVSILPCMECPLIHKYGKGSPGVVGRLETSQEYNYYDDFVVSDSEKQSHQSQESVIIPNM